MGRLALDRKSEPELTPARESTFSLMRQSTPLAIVGQMLDLRGRVGFGFSSYIQSPHWTTWLNPERAVFCLFGLAMATLGVIGWVFILRRRVRRQTDIITEKLKNEMTLEERYRNIFERNLTGLYIAEADGRILDCNDACARMLGYHGRHELLGNSARAEQIVQKFHETVARFKFHDRNRTIV